MSGKRLTTRGGDCADQLRHADSRTASNILLAALHESHWSASGWARFLAAACDRSLHQAFARPRAAVEATVLHFLLGALASPRSRSWVLGSWLLTMTHLGMLDDTRRLGVANIITLLRANLPALDKRIGQVIPVIALATDFLDGKLARVSGSVTSFGTHADFLSDTAVWTWYTLRKEPRSAVRAIVFAAWILPVAAISAISVSRGRIIEIPRSRWVRPSALVEVLVGGRAVIRLLRGSSR